MLRALIIIKVVTVLCYYFLKIFLITLCMSLHVFVCTTSCSPGGQKRSGVSGSYELPCRCNPGSSIGAVRAFNPRAISAIPVIAFDARQNELVLHVVRGARTTGATFSK